MILEKNEMLKEREHESYLLKNESAYFPKEHFRITFVDNSKGKKPLLVDYMGISSELKAGTILGVNELILANEGRVELRNNNGSLFRLGEHAELSLNLTALGIAPVFFGKVYKTLFANQGIMCGGKYQTSCWVQCSNTIVTENISPYEDIFYSFSESTEIWEYDEQGRRFHIVTLNEGEKVILEHNPKAQMRNRYKVQEIQLIDEDEYDKITDTFLNPKKWILKP